MYYQIEGRLNMKSMTFDEEGLTIGKQHYPIDEISNLEIANAPLFATYGIMTFETNGKKISVPFARSAIDKLKRAIHDFEHEQQVRKKAAEKAAEESVKHPAADATTGTFSDAGAGTRSAGESSPESEPTRHSSRQAAYMDPYEEIKKFKELLDLGIVTEEEFQKKKKELLGL